MKSTKSALAQEVRVVHTSKDKGCPYEPRRTYMTCALPKKRWVASPQSHDFPTLQWRSH
ncbi:MAG: hypothetical protein SAK29_33555 [Scytonema sp. PMC 1069.18]|nr:hypothetical protein [Scytonema sp. PMC 1069.18]MEC4887809.1 hypothetical protein [Scytonema sp. PMC 1070.18]